MFDITDLLLTFVMFGRPATRINYYTYEVTPKLCIVTQNFSQSDFSQVLPTDKALT
jgi:hypothetical protein